MNRCSKTSSKTRIETSCKYGSNFRISRCSKTSSKTRIETRNIIFHAKIVIIIVAVRLPVKQGLKHLKEEN